MATITAICNQKGGVGKTVTAVNLGIGLAREGKRVLLVDVDAQGSLTASLGYKRPDQMEDTLAVVLGHIIADEPLSPGKGIIRHGEGVDLLPANIGLSGLEVTLVNTMSRETILRDYLNSVRDQYDVILLDCCPSLGMLTINALAAADEVLIPMQAHYLSIKGLALTKLIPSLLVLVDEDKLAVSAAADYISVLPEQEQTNLASVMDKLDVIPVKGQLVKIKEQSKAGTLTITVIEAILTEGRPATVQVVLKQARLRQFFPQTYTAQQMEEVIVSLLETWSVQQR